VEQARCLDAGEPMFERRQRPALGSVRILARALREAVGIPVDADGRTANNVAVPRCRARSDASQHRTFESEEPILEQRKAPR